MKKVLLTLVAVLGLGFANAQTTVYNEVPGFTSEYRSNHTVYKTQGAHIESSVISTGRVPMNNLKWAAISQNKNGYSYVGVQYHEIYGIEITMATFYNAEKNIYKLVVASYTYGGQTLMTIGYTRDLAKFERIGYVHGYLLAGL